MTGFQSAYQTTIDSATSRALVVEAVEQATELIAQPEVAQRWDQPSALDGMTVGALCAHLVRAAGATSAYLDRATDLPVDAAGNPAEVLTPVTYFNAALEAPIHDRIKEVSADEASVGHDVVLEEARRVLDGLAERLPAEPQDRMIAALGGRQLTLDDFCRTRLIEVLYHLDDLAVSVGLESPPPNPQAVGEIAAILTGIARHRHGDWAVLRLLGRAERTTPGVLPVI